jgi:hypothetical protein
MTAQQRAKQTRARNKLERDSYESYVKPAHEKVEKLLNSFLRTKRVRVTWKGPWPLKNGVTAGTLTKIAFGGLSFTVHIDGYKHPRGFSSSFWEVN